MSAGPPDRIQAAIRFRRGERPAPCWRLLLLDVVPGAAAPEVRAALAAIVRMLDALRAGEVRELRGQPAAGVKDTAQLFDGFAALVGYGRSLFDPARHDPPLTTRTRPEFLAYLPARGDAFPAIPWVGGERPGVRRTWRCSSPAPRRPPSTAPPSRSGS